MTVSSQIIEVLNDLCKKFGIVIDWSSENIMPYIKELMSRFIGWEIATSIIWIVIGIIMMIVGIGVTWHMCKCDKIYDYGEVFVTSVALVAIGVVIIVVQCFDITEAIYLPEKTIYDFIRYQISLHN
jgi:hypothetical protein